MHLEIEKSDPDDASKSCIVYIKDENDNNKIVNKFELSVTRDGHLSLRNLLQTQR